MDKVSKGLCRAIYCFFFLDTVLIRLTALGTY